MKLYTQNHITAIYLLLVVLLAGIPSSVNAQTKTLRTHLSAVHKKDPQETLVYIVGQDDEGYFALKSRVAGIVGNKVQYSLEKYDYSSRLLASQVLELMDDSGRATRSFSEVVLMLDGQLYLFHNVIDTDDKSRKLYAQKLDSYDLAALGQPRLVARLSYAGTSRANSGNFGYGLSPDGRLLLLTSYGPLGRDGLRSQSTQVLDSDFEELYRIGGPRAQQDEITIPTSYDMDNDGNLYVLSKIYDRTLRDSRNGEPNYKYELTSYWNGGKDVRTYEIEDGGYFLTQMVTSVLASGDIICVGFYGDRDLDDIQGSFHLQIDKETRKTVSREFSKFDVEFLGQNLNRRKKKRIARRDDAGKDNELTDYELYDIIQRKDGGLYLVAENAFWRYGANNGALNNNLGARDIQYIHNDIVVISMTAKGEVEWRQKIAKRQQSTNDNGHYLSYAVQLVNDELYFVFNDDPRNLEYDGKGKVFRYGRQNNDVINMVHLTKSGAQSRHLLYSLQDAKVIARPKIHRQISEDLMVIYCELLRKERFLTLSFE